MLTKSTHKCFIQSILSVSTIVKSTRGVTEVPGRLSVVEVKRRVPTYLPTREQSPTYSPIISHTANPNPSLTTTSYSQITTSQAESPPPQAVEEETTTTITIQQSYCATDYDQLLQNCAILSACNRYKSCPDGYMCFSNFMCTTVTMSKPAFAAAKVQITSPPTPAPITSAPISNAPISNAPITHPPTQHPTISTPSDDEVAQRLTNMNKYCASSLSQVLSTCSRSLYLCNDRDTMSGVGTLCLEDIVCSDVAVTKAPVTADLTPIPTPSPMPKPVPSSNNNIGSSKVNSAVAQNYCP